MSDTKPNIKYQIHILNARYQANTNNSCCQVMESTCLSRARTEPTSLGKSHNQYPLARLLTHKMYSPFIKLPTSVGGTTSHTYNTHTHI